MKLQVSICTVALLVQSIAGLSCYRPVAPAPPCGCGSESLSITLSESEGQSYYQPLPPPLPSCGCYQPLPLPPPVPLPTPIPSCGCNSNRLSIGISEGLGQSCYQPLPVPLPPPVPLPTPIPSCGCGSNRLSIGLSEGLSRYQPLPVSLPAPSCGSNSISIGISEGSALSSYQSVVSAPSYGAVSIAVPDYGGALAVNSIGPIAPSGIAVATDVGLAGDLYLSGVLPYLSAVAFEGQFDTNGVVPVSYGCGDVVAITEQLGGASVGVANAIGGLANGGGSLSINVNGGRSCGCGCY